MIRRALAVILLSSIGMLVVSALFASPARRTAYRPEPTRSMLSSPSPASGHAPQRPGGRRGGKNDHC